MELWKLGLEGRPVLSNLFISQMNTGTQKRTAYTFCSPTSAALTTPNPALGDQDPLQALSYPKGCREQAASPYPPPLQRKKPLAPTPLLLRSWLPCPFSCNKNFGETPTHTLPVSVVLPSHCSHPNPQPRSCNNLLGTYYVSHCCEHWGSCPPDARSLGDTVTTPEHRDSAVAESAWSAGVGGAVPPPTPLTARFLPLSPAPSCSLPWPAALPTQDPGPWPHGLCGAGESSAPEGGGLRGPRGPPRPPPAPRLGGGSARGAELDTGPTARSVPPHAPPRPDSEGLGGRGRE